MDKVPQYLVEAVGQEKLDQLFANFGTPKIVEKQLTVAKIFSPLSKLDDRIGEAIMVCQRPNGNVVLVRRGVYPKHIYRLPTGGIKKSESLAETALRETYEELGVRAKIEKLLAIICYQSHLTNSNSQYNFVSFIWQLAIGEEKLENKDPHEDIVDYLEVPVDDLGKIADQLNNLTDQDFANSTDTSIAFWAKDWGHFRAIGHKIALQTLTKEI